MDDKFKAQYKKDFKQQLGDKPTKESVIER